METVPSAPVLMLKTEPKIRIKQDHFYKFHADVPALCESLVLYHRTKYRMIGMQTQSKNTRVQNIHNDLYLVFKV